MGFENQINKVVNLKEDVSVFDVNRKKAFLAFNKMGVPTKKNEDWKYSSLKWMNNVELKNNQVSSLNFSTELPSETFNLIKTKIEDEALADSYKIVLINGVLENSLSNFSTIKNQQANFKVLSLKDCLEKYVPKLKEVSNNFEDKYFDALNVAFSEEVTVVDVEKNQQVNKPIEIINIVSSLWNLAGQSTDRPSTGQTKGRPSTSRVFVYGNSLAEATVIQRVFTLEEKVSVNQTNLSVIGYAEEGARIKVYQVNGEMNSSLIDQVRVLQKNNSSVEVLNISAGGDFSRHDAEIKIDGEGAFAGLYGLYLGQDKEHVDYCTKIIHSQPNSESEQLCKGILSDKASAVFNGLIRIEQKAQKTNSSQLNKNLILSNTAEVNTKPQLRIDADDVKASHGSTIGQLNEEELFYLQSRAINKEEAVQILAQGFVEDVLFKIQDKNIRENFTSLVRNKMRKINGL